MVKSELLNFHVSQTMFRDTEVKDLFCTPQHTHTHTHTHFHNCQTKQYLVDTNIVFVQNIALNFEINLLKLLHSFS